MPLYVIGDLHGNQYIFAEKLDPFLCANPGSTLIVLGDFGIGFWDGRWPEEWFLDNVSDSLSESSNTLVFIDGNHEDFNKLRAYPVNNWNGGRVHFVRKNIIHLMRGEIFNIDGNSVFVMGGGYSIDKARRKPGVSWWPEEMPSEEEYENARRNLAIHDNKVDFVLSHTAPAETVGYMSSFPELYIKNNIVEERELTTFLDYVNQTVTYKHWYFGHFHLDKELWRNQTAVFLCIRELTSGEIMRMAK